MIGVIMAGGFGTRLKPLTCNIPKPMVPVTNRPMMEHVVLLLKRHGIHNIVTLLFHQPEKIKTYFKDGRDFDANIIYQQNTVDYGTAGSLKQAQKHLKERFLVISGDLLTDTNLSEAIAFHKQKKALATIILTHAKNPLEYGIVMTNRQGEITRFLEKPGWGQVFSDTINTGQYILEPEILDYIPPGQAYDFSKDLFPLLLENREKLYGYISNCYWKDVGNLREYQMANWDCIQGNAKIKIAGTRYENTWIGEGFEKGENVVFKGAVAVGDNCKLGSNIFIQNSVIGDNCTIGSESNIVNSIIWNDVMIEKQVLLDSDVIASNTHIKENAYIGENAFISENCVIGKNSTVRSNIKMWPDKIVEDDAVLTTSLVWGDRWLKELFTDARITGRSNTEISPEFGAKLGGAFGAMLGVNSFLLIGRDSAEGSRMISRALASGLMAAGVHVRDLQDMPIPIVRYLLRSGKEIGGIFVRQSPFDEKLIDILFFDDDGRDLPVSKTKAIERLFYREDFHRAAYNQIGKIDFPVRQAESYAEDFLAHLDLPSIEKAQFKVVVDYSHGGAASVLPKLLGSLGCEIISLNAYLDSRNISRNRNDFTRSLNQLSNIVTSLKADIGFLIDAGAEKIFVVDEKGRFINGDRLLVLITNLLINANHPQKIAVPITASSQIEQIAQSRDIQVFRTANDHRSLIEAYFKKKIKFAGDTKGGFIFTQFQFAFDGMFAMAKILELMARSRNWIGQLHDSRPQLALQKVNIPCSWENKGYVMRRLMEETESMERELIDGIKIFFKDAWLLIIPDRTRPFFHVNAESANQELAQALVDEYAQKIGKWVKEK